MKRILVCTVGGSPDPVIHAVRDAKAEFVYLLPSSDSAKGITEAVRHPRTNDRQPAITDECALLDGQFEIVEIPEPDSLEAVLDACRAVEKMILERFSDSVDVFANYTGGTKTMSAGLVLFGCNGQNGWRLQVQVGRRRDTVSITAGDIAQRQNVCGIHAEFALARAQELANERYDYEGAISIARAALTGLDVRDPRADRLRAAIANYEVDAARDRFDYAGALGCLEGVDGSAAKAKSGLLRKIRRAHDLLQGSASWPGQDPTTGRALLEDLLDNAERCAKRARFDDAVGRLYRATELLAQLRLLRAYGVRTGDVQLHDLGLADEVVSRFEIQRDPRSGKIKLGARAAFDLLVCLDDPVGGHFSGKEGKFGGWLLARNESWFAHGYTPIDPSTWGAKGRAWLDWLREGAELLEESCQQGQGSRPRPA